MCEPNAEILLLTVWAFNEDEPQVVWFHSRCLLTQSIKNKKSPPMWGRPTW
jgi:hypothetical protein